MSMVAVGRANLLLLAAALLGGGAGGASIGGTPLPPDAGLQSVAPPSCLLYVAHHGSTAADAKSPNEYERLLAEPELQGLFGELNRVVDEALKLLPPANDEPSRLLAKTMPTIVKTLLSRPSTLYLADVQLPPQAPSGNAGFVIHTGDQTAALRDAVEQWERFYLTQIPPNMTVETSTIEGVDVRRLPLPPGAPPVVWGVADGYMFLAVGEDEAKNLLGRLRAKSGSPEWLKTLTAEAKVPRLSGLLYVNAARVFELAEPLVKPFVQVGLPIDFDQVVDAIGLRQLRYLAVASGLDESVAVSKLLIGRDAADKGIIGLLGGKPLSKADFAGVPRSADFALVTRLDGAAIFDRVLETVRQIEPRAFEEFTRELGQAEEQIGFSPRRDLLDGLGDLWSLYNSPSEGGSLLTGACLSVSVHNRAKVERVIEQLLRIAAAETNRGDKPAFAVRKTTVGEHTISYLQILQAPVPITPAWCVTNDRLIIALFPQMVRVHLSRPAEAGSLADVEAVAKQLATGDVTTMSYADTKFGIQILYSYLQYAAAMGASALEKETGIQADLSKFPSFTAIAPHIRPSIGIIRSSATVWSAESYATGPSVGPAAMIGLTAGLTLPGVQKARETAREATMMNNLRQVVIAALSYEQTVGKPLPRAIVSADGKPLLSWRVALLPYLERQDLYQQFHLDEPWDSDHNRKLIAEMPSLFAHPSAPEQRELGATMIQIPVGEGTLYGETIQPKKFTEGNQSAWFVVTGMNHSVVWTKPEDVEIDPQSPFDVFFPRVGDDTVYAARDASVHRVQAYSGSPDEEAFLKALLPHKEP